MDRRPERTDRLTALSKRLSHVLRHRPEAIGIELDQGGWVDVDLLIDALTAHGSRVTRDEIDALTTHSLKQRFEVVGNRIRAAQGHSRPVDLGLPPREPPAQLFHGTVKRFLPSIMCHGLTRGGRQHVHLSPDRNTAHDVGARRGQPVILTVDAAAMHQRQHVFYLAANGVWLTAHVPPEHLSLDEHNGL